MKKRIIALSMVALLFVSVGCGCGKKEEKVDDKAKMKANTSEDIVKNQVVDNMNFSNVMMLIDENGQTNFSCEVQNKTQKDITSKYVLVHVTDASGKELAILTHGLDGLKAGETKSVSIGTDADLTNAKAVTYEFSDKSPYDK